MLLTAILYREFHVSLSWFVWQLFNIMDSDNHDDDVLEVEWIPWLCFMRAPNASECHLDNPTWTRLNNWCCVLSSWTWQISAHSILRIADTHSPQQCESMRMIRLLSSPFTFSFQIKVPLCRRARNILYWFLCCSLRKSCHPSSLLYLSSDYFKMIINNQYLGFVVTQTMDRIST